MSGGEGEIRMGKSLSYGEVCGGGKLGLTEKLWNVEKLRVWGRIWGAEKVRVRRNYTGCKEVRRYGQFCDGGKL